MSSLTSVASLSSGPRAGSFLAFSAFVTPALPGIHDKGVAEMESINIRASILSSCRLFATALVTRSSEPQAFYTSSVAAASPWPATRRLTAHKQMSAATDGAAFWARYLRVWTERMKHGRETAGTVGQFMAMLVGGDDCAVSCAPDRLDAPQADIGKRSGESE